MVKFIEYLSAGISLDKDDPSNIITVKFIEHLSADISLDKSADPTFQPPQNQRHRQHHLDIAIPPTQKPEQRTQRFWFTGFWAFFNAADPSFQPPLNQHHLDIAIPPTQTPEHRTQRTGPHHVRR
ncbi:hypothetical protein GBA52_026162 [Prunus armeniaca]|nr:hypothetical protein GBA52_026162 [Prunus armeniaca]